MNHQQTIAAARDIDARYLEPICSRIDRHPNGTTLYHLRWMVQQIAGGMSEAKASRWLGYIQGILVGVYNVPLDEMKELSKRAVQP